MNLKWYLATAPAAVLATLALAAWGDNTGMTPKIERLDAALDSLLSTRAPLEKLATGFKWTEGPVWIHSGYLLFAEIPSNTIRKWAPGGEATIFLKPSGYTGTEAYGGPEPGSNGMTLDPKGRLTVAGHARRNVWRMESSDPNGQITVLADQYQGKRFNSPNDLVYKSDGALYFTDPPYGLRTQKDQDSHKELQINGVYRIDNATSQAPGTKPDNSKLKLLVTDLPRPNGIVFSPDEKTLYVNNSEPQKIWMKYPVQADGSIGKGTLLYDASSDPREGSPDGMKVDKNGNLYSTGPGGIWIFSARGKHIGTISMPEKAGNLAWGDADGKSLYITASSGLYRLRTKAVGLRP